VQSLIDQNKHSADVAQAAYEAITAQYNLQSSIPEEILPELQAARDSIVSFRRVAASLEPKLEELRGLVHPIRRYPDDILRLVFEEHVEGSSSLFYAAVTLSHVCQRSRAVTISTPRLWREFKLSLTLPITVIRSKVDAFVTRVKEIPATILIHFESRRATEDKLKKLVPQLSFGWICQVPKISTLGISISPMIGDPSPLLVAIPEFPQREIDQITLRFAQRTRMEPNHRDRFITKLPPCRKLFLVGRVLPAFPVLLKLPASFGKIKELDMVIVEDVPIVEILTMMPQLTSLRHSRGTTLTYPKDGQRYSGNNLRVLSVSSTGFPWHKLQFPYLVRFDYYQSPGIGEGHSFWEFVSCSPAITDVSFVDCGHEQLIQLAHSLPGIQRLRLQHGSYMTSISVLTDWEVHQFKSPPFPNLQELLLHKPETEVEVGIIDRLIQGRCLPKGDSESTMGEGIACPLARFELLANPGAYSSLQSSYIERYLSVTRNGRSVRYSFPGWPQKQRAD
jgi:hypothetical protein